MKTKNKTGDLKLNYKGVPMKRIIFLSLLASIFILSLSVSSLGALLTDQAANVRINGTLVASANLTVNIYDVETGGSPVYTELFEDAVTDGSWDVTLGETASLTLEYGKTYYLDQSINSVDLDYKNNTGGTTERKAFISTTGEIGSEDLDLDGNVGIGTDSPSEELHIQTSGNSAAIILDRSDSNNEVWIGAGGSNGGIGTTSGTEKGFQLYANGTTAVQLQPSGNVGIGTDNPTSDLHVYSSDYTIIDLEAVGGGSYYPGLQFTKAGSRAAALFINSDDQSTMSGAAANDTILVADGIGGIGLATNSAAPDLYIDGTSGNVGIGTTSPSGTLEIVSGNNANNILIADASADSTLKEARIGVNHYINSEEPMALIYGASTGTNNIVNIGGGTTTMNAPTYISLYTATDDTTITGTERMRIDSSGNVGIGTTSPNSKLEVSDGSDSVEIGPHNTYAHINLKDGSGNAVLAGWSSDFRINNSGNWDFVIDSSGKVGIGTTNPTSKLAVSDSSESDIRLIRDDSTTTTDELLGNIKWSSTDGNVDTVDASAMIEAYAAEDFGTGNKGSYLVFKTKEISDDFNHNADEWMRITEAGKVGIGTTNPGTILELKKSSPTIRLTHNNDWYSEIQGGGGNGNEMAFLINGTGEAMRIDGDGNLGIGTAFPAELLHVQGGSGSDPTIKIRNIQNSGGETAALEMAVTPATDPSVRLEALRQSDGSIDLQFYTANTTSIISSTPQMVIDGVTGNVGIGTTTPEDKLDLNGGTSNVAMRIGSQSTNLNSTIRLIEARDTYDTIGGYLRYDGISNLLQLGVNEGGSQSNDNPVINIGRTSGKVGIGTTTPDHTLHVYGGLSATNDIFRLEGGRTYNFQTTGESNGKNLRIYGGQDTNKEYLYFDKDGQVGINTTNPAATLEIGGADATDTFSIKNSAGTSVIKLWPDGNGNGKFGLYNSSGTRKVLLESENAADSYINNGGDFGIGTDSPGATLTIKGNQGASDILRIHNQETPQDTRYCDFQVRYNSCPGAAVQIATQDNMFFCMICTDGS